MTWGDRARDVIQEVINEHPEADERTLRRLVSEAYPFGQRDYYPYKAWLQAVEQLLGPSPQRIRAANDRRLRESLRTGQEELFGD